MCKPTARVFTWCDNWKIQSNTWIYQLPRSCLRGEARIFRMVLLDGPRPLKDVAHKKFWPRCDMPYLGLAHDEGAEFAIYVLQCRPHDTRTAGPFWYIGFCEREKVVQRIGSQFNGGKAQSHYCKINKPQSVHLVWPVHNRAAEAYRFHAMLSKQPAGWERRGAELSCPIGGFTQNATK